MKRFFEAILFDLDGTLADTMEDNFLAWKKSFEQYNTNITREDYFPLEGLNLLEISNIICKKYSLSSDNSSRIVKLKNKYYLENHDFRFYPGAEELVNVLKKDKLLALVSTSPREKLEKTVPKNFLKNFNVIISGDDVQHGKPAPEPYLKAIDALFLKPEQCIVIENAPFGIQSAKAAGIYCIALATTLSKKELKLADEIVCDIKNLKEILFLGC